MKKEIVMFTRDLSSNETFILYSDNTGCDVEINCPVEREVPFCIQAMIDSGKYESYKVQGTQVFMTYEYSEKCIEGIMRMNGYSPGD